MIGSEILSLAEGLNPNFVRGSSDTINLAWLNRISTEFYDVAFNLDPQRYIKDVNIPVIAGTNIYTFIDLGITDFESIEPRTKIRFNQSSRVTRPRAYPFLNRYKIPSYSKDIGVLCGLFRFDSNDELEENYRFTGKGSITDGYYLGANAGIFDKIVLTPNNTQTETRVLRYVPVTPILSALSDTLFLPSAHKFQMIYTEYLSMLSAKSQTAERGEIDEYEFERNALISRFRKELKPRTSNVIAL